MSSSTTGFTEEGQLQAAQTPLNIDYILTEEKMRMLKECQKDSFFYMSGPLSMVSMTITQSLVGRGILSASPRFGSLPKVFFAGLCGFVAGKLLYLKICQEKLQRLKNSPVGEIVRQRSQGPQLELSDPDTQSFEPVFQPAEALSHMSSYSKDYGYGYSPEPPAQMDKGDNFSAPVQSYVEEEEPKRKSILYEDLRLKNRENYEVMLTQKADSLLKTPPTKEPERPKKEMKNVYGDTWEE